jgi:hypothetical protein
MDVVFQRIGFAIHKGLAAQLVAISFMCNYLEYILLLAICNTCDAKNKKRQRSKSCSNSNNIHWSTMFELPKDCIIPMSIETKTSE